MQIQQLELLRGAVKARGVAVVIDVFRASSNIVTLFSRGAAGVVPVATLEEARAYKAENPAWVLAGERHGLPPEGFDFGNSPYEAERFDVAGKTVVLTTSAGSKGLVTAAGTAETVLVGCFLNARAVVERIKALKPAQVCFLALGVGGEIPSPEDTLAGHYMQTLLEGGTPDFPAMVETIRNHPEGAKFLDPGNTNYIPEDFHACLRENIYDIVPVLKDGRLIVE